MSTTVVQSSLISVLNHKYLITLFCVHLVTHNNTNNNENTGPYRSFALMSLKVLRAGHWWMVLHNVREHNRTLFWTIPKCPQMAPSWSESSYTFSKWNKLATLISSKWNKFLLRFADTTLITFRWELAEYEIGHDRLITSQKSID